MTYKMFIDDERYPPDDGSYWYICRNYEQVRQCINRLGWPSFISFDHDLGEHEFTGKQIANYLIHRDILVGDMPDDFSFYVHSQNPIGAENIRALLNNYLEFKANNHDTN